MRNARVIGSFACERERALPSFAAVAETRHAAGRTRGRRLAVTARLLGLLGSLLSPAVAHAGGFEIPDNGTQALGRGGAFVAKSDDPTAIYFNPAGLARQRGTRLLVDANLYLHSFEFQRAGRFPDDPDDGATPWGGEPFPLVTNSGGPFFVPFAALTTDFGSLDRVTAAVGVYSPPTIGNRTFPLGVANAPASSRYDFIQSRGSYIYPTASLAYRVTPWLDLGLSGHLILAKFDTTSIAYADTGQCVNVEYQPCDSRLTLDASGTAFAATIGAMIRPSANVAIGATFHTPSSIEATGSLTPEAPKTLDAKLAPGAATLSTRLPWKARLGARYVEVDGDFEVYDLELDATYEAWNGAQGDGARLRVASLGDFKNIDALLVRGYRDTVGVRAGGAYNFEALGGVVSARAGGYFDSAASNFAYTRVEYDALAKIAGTLGVGYKVGSFTFDFGYAAVASIPRLVGTGIGQVRPMNLAKRGRGIDGDGAPLDAVNEGAYRGFTHIVSIGATVTFDSLFGTMRAIHYGNDYEPGFVPEGEDESGKGDKAEKEGAGDKAEEPKTKVEPKTEEPKKKVEEPKKSSEDVPPDPPKKKPDGKKDDKPKDKKKDWWEDLE